MKKTTSVSVVQTGANTFAFRERTVIEYDLKAMRKAKDLREMYAKLGLPTKVKA